MPGSQAYLPIILPWLLECISAECAVSVTEALFLYLKQFNFPIENKDEEFLTAYSG